jgi:hypothetical protein
MVKVMKHQSSVEEVWQVRDNNPKYKLLSMCSLRSFVAILIRSKLRLCLQKTSNIF